MKRIFALIVGLIPGGISALLALEILLRVFFPIPTVSETSWYRIQYPGIKRLIRMENNDFGFRSLSMKTLRKPPKTVRILCLGASATEQVAQSNDDMWASLLEKKLSQHYPNRRFEVAAFGRSGVTAQDLDYWAREHIQKYEPDVAVLLVGVNDLLFGAHYSQPGSDRLAIYRGREAHFKMFPHVPSTPFTAYSQLARHLEAMRWSRRKAQFGFLKQVDGASLLASMHRWKESLPLRPSLKRDPDPATEFVSALHSIVGFLKQAGITPVILSQPTLWKPGMSAEELNSLWMTVRESETFFRASPEVLAQEMARFNLLQRQVADQEGVLFIDVAAQVPKTSEQFYDDCHFTDKGSQTVADAVFDGIHEPIQSINTP